MDCHHSIEDLGIVSRMALHQALEDKAGIRRYGSFYVPMDEALGFYALDVSGRAFLVFDTEYANPSVGTLDCCMVKEFFRALAFQAGLTLHLKTLYGENDHHKIEALFKAFAHALKEAVTRTGKVSLFERRLMIAELITVPEICLSVKNAWISGSGKLHGKRQGNHSKGRRTDSAGVGYFPDAMKN